MTRIMTIRATLIALVSAAWAVPLARAFRLLTYALSVDDGTIDAANDSVFGQSLVLSYCFSFGVAVALAWLLPSTRARLLIVPLAASLLVAIDVIRLKPESVIVIFPTMHPYRPAGFSLIVALTGALIIWLQRRDARHIQNTAMR